MRVWLILVYISRRDWAGLDHWCICSFSHLLLLLPVFFMGLDTLFTLDIMWRIGLLDLDEK